jgi:hypothetical protein
MGVTKRKERRKLGHEREYMIFTPVSWTAHVVPCVLLHKPEQSNGFHRKLSSEFFWGIEK